jgi:hypothetical protein
MRTCAKGTSFTRYNLIHTGQSTCYILAGLTRHLTWPHLHSSHLITSTKNHDTGITH